MEGATGEPHFSLGAAAPLAPRRTAPVRSRCPCSGVWLLLNATSVNHVWRLVSTQRSQASVASPESTSLPGYIRYTSERMRSSGALSMSAGTD